MNKILAILLLVITGCFGYAETFFNKGIPTSPNASYAITDTRYMLGGTINWMTNASQLTDTTAATGLPTARRVAGMMSIIGTTIWKLGSDLTTWSPVAPVVPFATMDNLTAIDPRNYPTNTVFQTMGYATPFDAGGTEWIWNPLATDSTNYSIVQISGITTGRLIRRVAINAPTTTATTLYLVGDSITHGAAVGAGNPNSRWGSLVGLTNGWQTHNLAYGGGRFADYLWQVFPGYTYTNVDYTPTEIAISPSAVTEDMVFAALMGYNDMRDLTPNVDYMTFMRRSLSAYIAWTGLPDTSKKMAQAADITTGTWTPIPYFGGAMGQSATAGSLTFSNIIGSSIYVCIDAFTAAASNRTFSVLIDTTGYGSFVCGPAYGNRFHDGGNVFQPTYIGPAGDGDIDRVPWVLRFDGLSRTAHKVTLAVTGASDGPVEILWVAGNGAVRNPRKGPYTLIGNTIRSSAAGYGVGSDSSAGGFSRQIEQVCRWFQRDGLNVLYVDANEYFNPLTMISGDDVHPTDVGHANIARAFQAALAPDLPQISAIRQSGEGIFTVDGDQVTMQIPGTTGQYARQWTWHGGSFPFFYVDMGAPLINGNLWEVHATPASTTGLQYIQKLSITASQTGTGRFVGLNVAVTENNPTTAAAGPSYPLLLTNTRSNYVANLLRITSGGDWVVEGFATNTGRTVTFQGQDGTHTQTNNEGSGSITLHFASTVTNDPTHYPNDWSVRNLNITPNAIYTQDSSNNIANLSLGNGGNVVVAGSASSAGIHLATTAGPGWFYGTGSPEGVTTGSVGSFYSQTDGTFGTALWVKDTGSGSTGWRQVSEQSRMVPTPTVLTDGATITWTMDNTFPRQQATVTLTGDRTLDLESLQSGMQGSIKVVQDSSGNHTLSPGGSSTNYINGAATTLNLSTAANAVDVWNWFFVSPNVYWSKGYSFQGFVTTDYAAQSVTYGKIQSTTVAGIVLGRSSGSTGSPEELTPGRGVLVEGNFISSPGGSMFMDILFKLGSAYKGCTLGYDPFMANSGNKLALASGTLRFVPIMFRTNFTATGVGILLETQGSFTGDATNSVAMYSDASGTLTKIAETANDANIWKAATTTSTKWPFASTVAVSANTVYWLGILYHQSAETTAPALPAPVPVNTVMGTLDLSPRYIGHLTGAGAQPGTQVRSGFSSSAGVPMVLVY